MKNNNQLEIKTFEDYSMVTFDRNHISMKGIRYITTEDFTCKIIDEDMSKMKSLLGTRLYEWALDGGNTIEIYQDEVFAIEEK
tara:strand:+ start:293 stop:541 length:249 start_codon:yes stop_codon:yes gene_type:complete